MARSQFTEEELETGIFRPSKLDPVVKEPTPTTIYYTIDGEHDYFFNGYPVLTQDGQTAFAKKDGNSFYVKSNGGQLADPRGLYESDLYRRVGDVSVLSWKQVSPKAFEYYIAYLKNANKSHYHNASREIFNG